MKTIRTGNSWRPIRKDEIEQVKKWAQNERRYRSIGPVFLLVMFASLFVLIVVLLTLYNEWGIITIFYIPAFVMMFGIPILCIISEHRKVKMVSEGNVRCLSVVVIEKRYGARRKYGWLYLIKVKADDRMDYEYDVSRKLYKEISVGDNGLLIRFDDKEEELPPNTYRFLPLIWLPTG